MYQKLPPWTGKVILRTMIQEDPTQQERMGVVGPNSNPFSMGMMMDDFLPEVVDKVDLSFYNYSADERQQGNNQQVTSTAAELEERKLLENGIKLLRMIKSSFQDIPNQILEAEQEIESFIQNVYTKNGFDRNDEWISKAFMSDVLIDKFFDWMMELLVDTTTSKLMYLLHVITVNRTFKENVKRRHLVRLCNYVLPYEKFEIPFNLYFGPFLNELLHLSWNVLETVLIDELKTTKNPLPPKERNKRGAQVLYESRCIDCLTLIATSNEIYRPKLLEIFEEILSSCEDPYITSIIVADMKALKLINKKSFRLIERAYMSKDVFEDITGTFFEFSQQVDMVDKVSLTASSLLNKKLSVEESKAKKRVRKIRDIAIASIVESGFKLATSTQFSDMKGEFDIDPNIYSVEKMFEHLKELNLLPISSIERLRPETEADKADFTKVSLMLLRVSFI